MTFLPEGYQAPAGNYLKFKEGDTTFRILSSAIVGYEYWTKENKPVRSREPFDDTPNGKTDDKGNVRVNHFWAFVAWNYDAQKVQIAQITQSSIKNQIEAYLKNPKWGDPKAYDFVVTRKGQGFSDTEYNVVANPKEDLDAKIEGAYRAKKIDLERLFAGEDPFSNEKEK